MKQDELNEIIQKHKLWLNNDPDGERADLSNAYLRSADLSNAYLRYAYLSSADLRNANLRSADLSSANLSSANLSNANLRNAYLSNAYLSSANLSYIKYNYLTTGLSNCPEGELVGWKKVQGKIVKLLIPKQAKRSKATTSKCRCSHARVLDIEGGEDVESQKECVYSIGKFVWPDKWDDDRWNECSNGIHFFLDVNEAKEWN